MPDIFSLALLNSAFVLYNRLLLRLLILRNIPLAPVGGVDARWLTGQNPSVAAPVGFVALFGIVLENGMV